MLGKHLAFFKNESINLWRIFKDSVGANWLGTEGSIERGANILVGLVFSWYLLTVKNIDYYIAVSFKMYLCVYVFYSIWLILSVYFYKMYESKSKMETTVRPVRWRQNILKKASRKCCTSTHRFGRLSSYKLHHNTKEKSLIKTASHTARRDTKEMKNGPFKWSDADYHL